MLKCFHILYLSPSFCDNNIVIPDSIPYSQFLLNIYNGSNLSDGLGPTLLHLYCIYLLFLALNGITEAFSQATMSIKQLET
jgi:hypothetical protein